MDAIDGVAEQFIETVTSMSKSTEHKSSHYQTLKVYLL